MQPVAINGKSAGLETAKNKRKPLPPAATGCRLDSMGKEGVSGSSPEEGSDESPAREIDGIRLWRAFFCPGVNLREARS
jgi:hypothetical protein